MTDITPTRKDRLRRKLRDRSGPSVLVHWEDLTALLDAIEERDRLRGLIDEVGAHVQWSSGSEVTLLDYLDQLCEEAGKAVVAVERVRELATEWAEQATDYDDDTEQQIADGLTLLRILGGTN